jgi:uncharacterized protein (TIGR03435 family)
LDGAWDFTLTFTVSGGGAANTTTATPGAANSDTSAAATPDGRVTLIEALDAQLGLKLETTKRPGPVFVIDRMEQRPLQ